MSPDKPLVSVVTPTLNSAKYIRDNVISILSQTYPHIEHIIVDGASSDDTLDIVRGLDPKAVIISERDRGIADAFNKGVEAAKGGIIAILNSDDYYAHPDVVKSVVETFHAHVGLGIVYGRARFIDPESGETWAVYGEPFSMKKMEKEIITPHPALFAKREVYEAVGRFSLEYKVCMDHDYFVRATKLFEPYFVDETLTVMRWGGQSTRNAFLSQRESYRIIRSNGGGFAEASLNLLYRYMMTAGSLLLQRAGLRCLLLRYRKKGNRW